MPMCIFVIYIFINITVTTNVNLVARILFTLEQMCQVRKILKHNWNHNYQYMKRAEYQVPGCIVPLVVPSGAFVPAICASCTLCL